MTEVWKDVCGYSGFYQVSNLGRVRSVTRTGTNGRIYDGKILSDCDNGYGYRVVYLKVNGKRTTHSVHRLVANAFLDNSDNKETVNHINGDKTDNCVTNLEWATYSENIYHSYQTGLHSCKHRKKVRCVETGVVFDSVKDANAHSGIRGKRVGQVCNKLKGCNTAGGYHWEWVND